MSELQTLAAIFGAIVGAAFVLGLQGGAIIKELRGIRSDLRWDDQGRKS